MSEREVQSQQQKREGDFQDSNLVAKKSKSEKVQEAQVLNENNDFVEIKADAAEDKGSRHTMEDAWVLMLDACPDPPAKLRFLFSCFSVPRTQRVFLNLKFYFILFLICE